MGLVHKMTFLKLPLFLGLALALAACTNPNRFDNEPTDATVDLNAGAPITDPATSDPGSPAYFSATVGDRVLFAVDEHTLSAEARSVLVQQAQWLNSNSQYTAEIEGHADEQGTTFYNISLSLRRAAAVQQFLISQGVAPNRLTTNGYGKERPIEICSEERCYAQNRRAVTVLNAGTS